MAQSTILMIGNICYFEQRTIAKIQNYFGRKWIFRVVFIYNAGIFMSKLMRSVSGIRGIVGDSLTPTTLLSHVKAFLEITKAKKIVIGRDSRPTGEAI